MTKQKLYCYVDETGQDTEGKLFIVVALIVEKEREHLEAFLEKAERESGKGKRKWIKTRNKERNSYIDSAFLSQKLEGKIFYRIQTDTKAYEEQTVIAIERAFHLYISLNSINFYRATIIIDGLNKKAAERMGGALRRAGIQIRKVKGARDESNAMLRLTDVVAGLIRESEEKNPQYKVLIRKLEKGKIINEL